MPSVFKWPFDALRSAQFTAMNRVRETSARLRGEESRERELAGYVKANAIPGDPTSVLEAMEAFARERRYLMHLGAAKGEVLDETIERMEARRVLELGTYCGYSAIRMGKLVARRGGEVVTLERSPEYAAIARDMIDLAGLTETIDVRVGTAHELISELQGSFDLVFIDHFERDYMSDLCQIEKQGLLRPGSVVVADNVVLFEREMRDYLERVRGGADYESMTHRVRVDHRGGVEDGVEVSVWMGRDVQAAEAAKLSNE